MFTYTVLSSTNTKALIRFEDEAGDIYVRYLGIPAEANGDVNSPEFAASVEQYKNVLADRVANDIIKFVPPTS